MKEYTNFILITDGYKLSEATLLAYLGYDPSEPNRVLANEIEQRLWSVIENSEPEEDYTIYKTNDPKFAGYDSDLTKLKLIEISDIRLVQRLSWVNELDMSLEGLN